MQWGNVRENTLELLVECVERLRVHLLLEEGGGDGDAATSAVVRLWDVVLG